MSRPQRNNVDYFPFLCEEGKKMFYLEETYGNDGFAVFVKLLRELARTNYHYLDLSKKTTLMFLSAKCKVSISTLEAIINDLVELEKFDSVLWNENRIIWCQDFTDSIQDAYSKRSNNCIDKKGLIDLLISLGIRKPAKLPRKPVKQTSPAPANSQSKVEYTKEEKNKHKEDQVDAPILEDENNLLDDSEIDPKIEKTTAELMKFFDFIEINNFNQLRDVNQALSVLSSNKRLEYFIEQFHAYGDYKAKTGEKRHGFKGFLGTLEEKFEDGGWNAENWAAKLKSFKPDQQQRSRQTLEELGYKKFE